jgi:hypothetical protein
MKRLFAPESSLNAQDGILRMELSVASPAESDEIFFNIIAQPTSRHNVVNF